MFGGTYFGLDLGTTSFKGAILDLDNLAVRGERRVTAPACIAGLPSTRHELDPAAVIDRVRGILRELLRDAPKAAGLVLCGQMHGLVLTDDKGRPRSNIITWRDQRALEPSTAGNLLETLRGRVSAQELDEIGGELRPGLPVIALSELRAKGPLPNGLFAASLSDFVVAALGGFSPTTDPTNAAAHGLYHLDRCDWHRGLIERLGLGALRWPAIHSFREPAGEIEIDGKHLKCFTPVGDQQCALAGIALNERELSLNISTGSQASRVGPERPHGAFLVRPYFDRRWLRTIVSVPAGRSLQLLVDLLSEMGDMGDMGRRKQDPWDYVRDAVESVGESDLEVDLSFFASLTGDRGRIANIHEGNLSVGHLFAAAFRSMAANYARCADLLSPNRDWDGIAFSGGLATRFPRLRRGILSALGDPPYRISTSEEDTLRGLLALALVCDGRAKTVEDAGGMLRR
jgi:sugar (pentulose or hexulose) kinase